MDQILGPINGTYIVAFTMRTPSGHFAFAKVIDELDVDSSRLVPADEWVRVGPFDLAVSAISAVLHHEMTRLLAMDQPGASHSVRDASLTDHVPLSPTCSMDERLACWWAAEQCARAAENELATLGQAGAGPHALDLFLDAKQLRGEAELAFAAVVRLLGASGQEWHARSGSARRRFQSH
jgi:hypothetical protein